MGEDGLEGSKAIRTAGGQILVQNKETSVVWGMPGAIAKAGIAEKILPLQNVASEMVTRVRHDRPAFQGFAREQSS
jgi:two-component system chemotaxis response regulator CheB